MPAGPRDFVGYGNRPPAFEWPNDARIALSIVVNYEEGSERSPLRGDLIAEPSGEADPVPAGTRNLTNESLYAYGARAGFWRLLGLLDTYAVKATFFAAAAALETNPMAARQITARGHEVCSHGYRWLPFSALSVEDQRDHIKRAVASIEATTGTRPVGWFSWSPGEETRALLQEEGGFLYDCDSYADELPFYVWVAGKPCLVLPYDQVNNDGLFSRPPGYSEPDDFFLHLKAAFDCLVRESQRAPKMMSVGLHLRFAGRPGRVNAVERFIEYAKEHESVWFATRAEIARWWHENVPPGQDH
jgi:peptidoglycan/xylan/chitin deacetylase (PgdA/CDA1 family)